MNEQPSVLQNDQPLDGSSVNQNPNPPPASSRFQLGKKQIILIAGALGIGILLIGVMVLILTPHSRPVSMSQNQPQPSVNQEPLVQKQTTSSVTPKLEFNSYILSDFAKQQQQTQAVSRYSLKNNFSEDDVRPIAAQFGLTNFSSQKNGYVASNTDDQNELGFMGFDKTTGSFQVRLSGTQKSPNDSQLSTVQQKALATLQAIGVADPSVECQITYRLKTTPGITYVECHRNWQKLTLPLIDFAGIMNMKANDLISKATPGEVYPNTLTDSDVINVINSENEKARPNTFNSATVGIRQNGTILSIDSNLRWIKDAQVISAQNLISKEQAISLAENKKSELYFSLPSPNDKAPWSKIYPSPSAKAKTAAVSEVLLVYLEEPGSTVQQVYEPYYLIRGTAFLESGHAVKYIQALLADKSKYTDQELLNSQRVNTASSSDQKQLQLEAFTPVFEEPPANEAPPTQGMCTKEELTKNPGDDGGWLADNSSYGYPDRVDIPGYGPIKVRIHGTSGTNRPTDGFYITSLNNNKPIDLNKVAQYFVKTYGAAVYGSGEGCYITGISPAIFIYPKKQTTVEVKLNSTVTYANPYAANNEWSVIANPDGRLNMGDHLYYEYDFTKTNFNIPTEGYIVSREDIKTRVEKIAKDLKLNVQETEMLVADSENAIKLINSKYIKVGIASRETVNKNLPLEINPVPDTLIRVNLTFASANKKDVINPPRLVPVERKGYTVVEVGVSIAE